MTETEYRAFIAQERKEGKAYVSRLTSGLRRQVLGRFPDSIDHENYSRITAGLGDIRVAMQLAAQSLAPLKVQLAGLGFEHEMHRWRAECRIALGVLPPAHASAVVTSLSLP